MPVFPKYLEILPECLRLFRPFHYVLLAYWVYFRPNALKGYFYQALPELFTYEKPIGFFRKWGTSAFRNLFVMLPIVCMTLTVLLSAPITILSAWKLQVPVNWEQWFEGGMLGVALGVTIGMAFGMVGRVIGGVGLSTIVGVSYGIMVGVLGGVSFSVGLGVSFASLIDGALIVGAVFGIIGGSALALDIEIGIALSLAFAMMAAMSFGAEFIASKVLGLHFGALQVRGVMSAAFVCGAFRLLFYPFQLMLAFCGLGRESIHPVFWDELAVLPLPFTRWLLTRKLKRNEEAGLRFLASVGRNLFRRAVLQAVLYRHLHKHSRPLHFLYHILSNPAMEEYLLVPSAPRDWEQYVSVRRVFLGELALRIVEATQHPRFHRSAWWFNLRKRRDTTLTKFAGMLYDLSDEHNIERDSLDLEPYREIYSSLSAYSDGEEIALSYEAMATFLSYNTLSELPSASEISSHLTLSIFFHDAIRPTVLRSITQLGEVGADIGRYFETTTQQTQLAALARTAGDLNELHDYVSHEVMAPEQYILQRIVYQWQQLIIAAIGELGKADVEL